MTWEEFWTSFKDFFTTRGWPIVEAILVFICGFIVIKIIMKIIRTAFKRSKMEKITQSFLLSVIKYALYLILLLIVLQILGVPITAFVAALSAAGLAIGLALQNSLTNLASGIIIVSTKPFKAGDYISVNGVEGKVQTIHILTTTITTKDNKNVIIPNSIITANCVTNYHANSTRRIDFQFSVAYSEDMRVVRDTILNVFKTDGRVLSDPEPMVRLDGFGDSGLKVLAACWVDKEDYWNVYWQINEYIISEFNRLHITIPYNQVEVRMRTDTPPAPVMPLPERKEKVRVKKKKSKIEELLEGEIPDKATIKKRIQQQKEERKQKKAEEKQKRQEAKLKKKADKK